MTRLILKIALANVALFILLVLTFTFIAFGMGYASKNAYNRQLTILYILTALIQIAINYLAYKKQIANNWKVLLVIIFTVIILMLFIL